MQNPLTEFSIQLTKVADTEAPVLIGPCLFDASRSAHGALCVFTGKQGLARAFAELAGEKDGADATQRRSTLVDSLRQHFGDVRDVTHEALTVSNADNPAMIMLAEVYNADGPIHHEPPAGSKGIIT